MAYIDKDGFERQHLPSVKPKPRAAKTKTEGTMSQTTKATPGPWRILPDAVGSVESESGIMVAQALQTRPVLLGSGP
jgi:hypothetical protein